MEYNYKKLSDLQTRINRLNHLKEVAFWDQATNMSEKGLNARSEAIAELSQIVHELECDPNNKKIIFVSKREETRDRLPLRAIMLAGSAGHFLANLAFRLAARCTTPAPLTVFCSVDHMGMRYRHSLRIHVEI